MEYFEEIFFGTPSHLVDRPTQLICISDIETNTKDMQGNLPPPSPLYFLTPPTFPLSPRPFSPQTPQMGLIEVATYESL